MSYLEEFQLLLEGEKLSSFLHLWEEYCLSDEVHGEEVIEILKRIKESVYAPAFGQIAETTIPLWEKIKEEHLADLVLRLILDLQTTNTPLLADLATSYLSKHYKKDDPDFNEKMRLVGLRARHQFQGAITNYELLSHMKKGNFVFHVGGWGVGEVMEISLLQEHVLLEFEGIGARKDLSFENAFKNLVYLPSDHFLARRFGNPDALEKEGKENPLALIHLLLRDLGPKTAQEIKEELCELVIPEEEWSKWWNAARTKIKKDTKIFSPSSSKEPFALRNGEMTHETQFHEALKKVKSIDEFIQTAYTFVRDFPEVLKKESVKLSLKERLLEGLEGDESIPEMSLARKVQISFLLEDVFPSEFPQASASLIQSIDNLEGVLSLVEILAFKKRLLMVIRKVRKDWEQIFLHLLFLVGQNALRDFIFKELYANPSSKELAQEKVHTLLNTMTLHAEAFFWYFQKLIDKEEIPFNDQKGGYQFLEAYLILLHYVEDHPEYRDLTKKMYTLLIAKRYAVVRSMIEGASVSYLKEFLLLASKCHMFSKQDIRILHALAEVVQPSLAQAKKGDEEAEEVIWTTAAGYQKLQQRIQEIGTVEMIDNAKEIEVARSHGDLRENAEYKFALERRNRLQAELKMLSRQLNCARILTKEDISLGHVGPGSVVELLDSHGKKMHYALLGPWDADPDNHVLSFQSKFAQAMIGHQEGDTFDFQGTHYHVHAIRSYLE